MADNLGVTSAVVNPNNLPEVMRQLVFAHVKTHLEKTDTHVTFSLDEVYVVWFSFTLGNWKGLCSTTLPDGKYYEVTHRVQSGMVFIDEYVKINNVAVDMT